MLCYVMLFYVMLILGTYCSLDLKCLNSADCVLAVTRNYKPVGTGPLHTAIMLVKPPILQQFASAEELPLYVEAMAHESQRTPNGNMLYKY